jgi:hypothetical protein
MSESEGAENERSSGERKEVMKTRSERSSVERIAIYSRFDTPQSEFTDHTTRRPRENKKTDLSSRKHIQIKILFALPFKLVLFLGGTPGVMSVDLGSMSVVYFRSFCRTC